MMPMRFTSRSLNDSGVMFIGGTETLLGAERLGFERIGPSFYRKSGRQERAAAGLSPAA